MRATEVVQQAATDPALQGPLAKASLTPTQAPYVVALALVQFPFTSCERVHRVLPHASLDTEARLEVLRVSHTSQRYPSRNEAADRLIAAVEDDPDAVAAFERHAALMLHAGTETADVPPVSCW
jgi:hypothetical protein